MYDDGAHGDGFANDGIYGNLFTRTGTKGTYIVDVHATGTSASYGVFSREMSESFHLFEIDRFDADLDTLPDVWEQIHGLNFLDSTGDNGASGDPDREGLLNREELKHGTNPRVVDTDKGGESDLSEINNGRDPYNPIDDFFSPPILQGHASDNKAIIEFSVKPSYSTLAK